MAPRDLALGRRDLALGRRELRRLLGISIKYYHIRSPTVSDLVAGTFLLLAQAVLRLAAEDPFFDSQLSFPPWLSYRPPRAVRCPSKV